MNATTNRQLIVLCDGTNNNLTGQENDTNLVKLAELLARDPDPRRLVFYDPGVGNPGELPGVTLADKIKNWKERVAGLAFGGGVYENIADCYRFLMREYREGDEIFIFGFSRGAFTARSLSGLVNQFGLLAPQLENFVPTLLHVYFSERPVDASPDGEVANWKKISEQAVRLLVPESAQYVEMQYVGVWDTVASVGMFPFNTKFTAKPTIQNKRFRNVRQALALDELRAQFGPRAYKDENGDHYQTQRKHKATLKQLWFQGDHCDVGGGHATGESGYSNAALTWLVSEAVNCGLSLKDANGPLDTEAKVAAVLKQTYPAPVSLPVVHSQLFNTCLWAVTGLKVRDTQCFKLDDGTRFELKANAYSSEPAPGPFPMGTAWTQARPKRGLLVAVLMMTVVFFCLGQMLVQAASFNDLVFEPLELLRKAPAFFDANMGFACWQLTWWWSGGWDAVLNGRFWAPRWAVVWDFLFIAAYAYALSWFAVRSFARAAGVRTAGAPVSKFLNALGWSLTLMVFADVFENALTWLMITSAMNDLTVLAYALGIAMSMCALAKFVGLAGVGVLILRGWKAG
ncbi:MAG: DUF2235 domain-containing protein [Betaproteobacteria bacterium]|nr:DUF2235 domain-containing protein [Betaproteobacteria bacterium]